MCLPFFWQFSIHKMAKINSKSLHLICRTQNRRNFKSLAYISCPNECTFCDFSVSWFKGFSRSVFTIYRQIVIFKKLLLRLGRKISSCGFIHLVHLNEIYQSKLIKIFYPLDPPTPHPFGIKWQEELQAHNKGLGLRNPKSITQKMDVLYC